MRPDDVSARREYHARRSAQEKRAAEATTSFDVAQRHLVLHRLHEMKCIEFCCTPASGKLGHQVPPAVKSAPHRVIFEATDDVLIEFSPEEAVAVADLMIAKAAEACGDGLLADEMTTRRAKNEEGYRKFRTA